jgi:enoyl-CoA hydratase/carnithine racemase
MPDAAHTEIGYEVDGDVAVITLDRPERMNAFTATMLGELIDAFDRTDADDRVRAVVVTGRGRAFCAGADLGAGARAFADTHAPDGTGDGTGGAPGVTVRLPRDGGGILVLRIFRSTKPVIAAINGSAVGIGITMTLPMDIRVMADSARVGFVFGARGIAPDGASSWFLPRVVGIERALEWCLTARVFRAEEALASGLVRSLHPAGDVLGVALDLAHEIARNVAPTSAVLTRALLWRMLGADHPMAAHRVESRAIHWLAGQPDASEGVASFLAKRPPSWTQTAADDLPGWFPWWDEPAW